MQSKTRESNTLFEQTKRSLADPSKYQQDRKNIVVKLKLPDVFSSYGPDEWFDWQSYADFVEWVETKNTEVKFDKELMDDGFERAYSRISKATINIRKKQYEKMKSRVSLQQGQQS